MPELLTPGVFIQEVEFGPQPIEGVSTSTAGFVGETERGTEGQPMLVTSFADYQRKFGGFFGSTKYLPLAVRGFFENGGRRAFIVRVAGSSANPASASFNNVPAGYEVALVSGPQPSSETGNRLVLTVASVVGARTGETVVVFSRVNPSTTLTVTIRAINAAAGSLDVEAATAADFTALQLVKPATHALRYTTAAVNPANAIIKFNAKDKGSYGARLKVLLTPMYLATASITAVPTGGIVVNQIAAFAKDQVVELEKPAGGRTYVTVATVDASLSRLTVTGLGTTVPAVGDVLRVTGWRLSVYLDGQAVETIGDIPSAAADATTFINASSQWVQVATSPAATIAIAGVTHDQAVTFPYFAEGQPSSLTGGDDGKVDDLAVIGTDQNGNRTGLKALEAQDGVSLIAAPGQTSTSVVNELIGQAERRLDRFAVFESNNSADIQTVMKARGGYNSKFAAMYHPWVKVLDPFSGGIIDAPPSGHILGAYARTDNDRGVFKAPANVTLRGVNGMSRVVPDGEQDLLNPAGVNVLRAFDGLGNVIWGARTVSAEGLWRYVSVRRLFIFIEQSIIRGTRFAVFEPNDQRLWAKLRDAITNFLTSQWRAGALFGAKPEQAFFVRVDDTTTTQDDRDNGRVNIIVGIAPVKPAEFIVFQIGQAPQSVIIAEQG